MSHLFINTSTSTISVSGEVIEYTPIAQINLVNQKYKNILKFIIIMNFDIKFVINTIAQVINISEDDFENDSENEELDDSFEKYRKDPPYIEDIFPYKIQEVKVNYDTFEIYKNKLTSREHTSTVIGPFLQKLSKQAFYDVNRVRDSISACFYLNKMLSVSQKRNDSLYLEANCDVFSNITHKKISYFWCPSWRNKEKKLTYADVQKYYKQLKTFDRNEAKIFIRETEDKVKYVPYQQLREDLKNHKYTKDLIANYRDDNNNNNNNKIYLCLIDADTINFNKIFEDYVKEISKYKDQNQIPRVISTGYVYPKEQSNPHYIASEYFDRQIRISIAKEFPLGVYYPEPNMCILIPENYNYVPESFIDNKIKKKNKESAVLIKNIMRDTEEVDNMFVFFNGNPLITKIPFRSESINFSDEFKYRAPPSPQDLTKMKSITQSSYKVYNWLHNLFANNEITLINNLEYHVEDINKRNICEKIMVQYNNIKTTEQDKIQLKENMKNYINEEIVEAVTKKYAYQYCLKIIKNLRHCSNTTELEKIKKELEFYIAPEITQKIIRSIARMNECIKINENKLIRTEADEILIKVLSNQNINMSIFINSIENQECTFKDAAVIMEMIKENINDDDFDPYSILKFLHPAIIELIQEELLDPSRFVTLDEDALELIFGREEIIDELAKLSITQEDLLEILEDYETKEYFINAIENGEYSVTGIIERYQEDPQHLQFLAESDLTGFVYENSMDCSIVEFAYSHYRNEVDWDYIIGELGPSAAEDFKIWIGFYDEYSPPFSEEFEENYSSEWDF